VRHVREVHQANPREVLAKRKRKKYGGSAAGEAGIEFEDDDNLEESDADGDIYYCAECDTDLRGEDEWRRHMITKHDVSYQRIKCSVEGCKKYFPKNALADHMSTHAPPQQKPVKPQEDKSARPFKCNWEGCDNRFKNTSHLFGHIQNVHNTDPRKVLGKRQNGKPRFVTGSTAMMKINKSKRSSLKPSRRKSLKMEVRRDPILCILCCFSFYPADDQMGGNYLSTNAQFKTFMGQELGVADADKPLVRYHFSSWIKHLSVCPDCRKLINKAVLDKEEDKLAEYFLEMGRIQSVVNGGDAPVLEAFLGNGNMIEGGGLLSCAAFERKNPLCSYTTHHQRRRAQRRRRDGGGGGPRHLLARFLGRIMKSRLTIC